MKQQRADVRASSDRSDLAAKQAAVVRALTGGGPLPEGFDPAGVAAAARSLARKRARGVARAHPTLSHALGARFVPLFAKFAAQTPLPARGGSSVDARAFLQWLARAGLLDDELRLEQIRIKLRRGWPVAAAWLRRSRRLVVGVALPRARMRWLWLPVAPQRLSGRAPSPAASSRRA